MPSVIRHEFRLTPVEELLCHPRNARTHCDAAIDESIAENGFYKPIVASSKSHYILAGHGCFERAKIAGIRDLPVYWLDGLSPAEELKILAADNRTADLAGYDDAALAELLTSIQSDSGSLQGSGWDQAAVDEMFAQAADDIMKSARHEIKQLKAKRVEQTDSVECEEHWIVVVRCKDEAEQVAMIEKFKADGLDCTASHLSS